MNEISTIRDLKNVLSRFNDDKFVSIFLDLRDEKFPNKKFGIVYDIINWGNNNGNLDLWISDEFGHLEKSIKDIKKRHKKYKKP